MFSLSRRTSRYNTVYVWDREGQSNIVEIAKKEVNIINLKSLNIDVFLSKFEAWKSADLEQKQSLFASLREMHQAVGINKASTVFGADEEMLAFGDYVSRVRDSQQKIQVAITAARPVVQPYNSIDITSPETLDPRSESIVPVVPPVVPERKDVKIKQKVTHAGSQKNITNSSKPEQVSETKIDFSEENKLIKGIIENAKKESKISTFNKDGSYYFGTSGTDIDYAVVKQPDDDSYAFDIPKNDIRIVYLINKNNHVIGVHTVDSHNKIKTEKGEHFDPVYMPTPQP